MKTLYLDIFSGISGDMFVGALLDVGVELESLQSELGRLKVEGFHLHADRKQKMGIEGVKFDVHLKRAESHKGDHTQSHPSGEHHVHAHGRDFAEIKTLIGRSSLSDWVKEKSIAVFQRIAVAEGKIHGKPPAEVHFHEVGAIDSIVDIVGVCIALDILGRPRVLASAPVEGTGFVNCAHGRFPVPTPATLEILSERGVRLSQCEEPNELITPTGAALLAEFVESFEPISGLRIERVGYGLGTRDLQFRPNVLRAVLGEGTSRDAVENDWESDTIAILETNLDDINSELLGHFVRRAFSEGALDVFHTPVQMKKNRPGVLLTVLCAQEHADQFTELILRETTAFGVRRSLSERRKLQRESIEVETPYGEVAIKLGKLNGVTVQCAPEFESCRELAERSGVTVKEVYEAAQRAIRK